MKPHALTRADLARTLGDIDDVIAAQLLAIGATLPELRAALRLLEDEPPDVDRPASPNVGELLETLRELEADDVEPEYRGPC